MDNITYIVTTLSIIGTIANSFQKRWCFVIWLCTNMFWCIYNFINKQYAQSILYLFNFILAVNGLIHWKKKNNDRLQVRYDFIKAENRKLKQENAEWKHRYESNNKTWESSFRREVEMWEGEISLLKEEIAELKGECNNG